MKILKNEKGSITLFVLISMLFFVMYIVGMYMLSAGKESSQIAETAKIKEIYEQGVNNIDDVYQTELKKSYKLLSKIAKPGDYIKYNTGLTDVGENGFVIFRVLYNDEINGLQIISDASITEVPLGGNDWETARTSYNNAIEILNSESTKYKGVLGLDARCVGSIPTVGLDGRFTNKNNEKTNLDTFQFTTSAEGASNMKGTDLNYEVDLNAMIKANCYTGRGNWWFASRKIEALQASCSFMIRKGDQTEVSDSYIELCKVLADEAIEDTESGEITYQARTSSQMNNLGLRPCISLRNGVKVVDGDGKSEDTAYVLDV